MPHPRTSTAAPIDAIQVLADAAALARRNAGALALALLPCFALAITISYAAMALALGLAPSHPQAADAPGALVFWLMFAGTFLSFAAVWALASAATARICLDDLAGGKPDGIAALGHVLRRFPSIAGLTILTALGLAAGAALFIWPAFYLAVIWSMALAVLIAGDTGVVEALQRSAALAAGNRWRIFGLILVCGLVMAMASLAAEAAAGADSPLALAVALAASSLWTVVTVALYGRRTGLYPQAAAPSAPVTPAARA